MFHNDSLAGNSGELITRLDRDRALDRWAIHEPALRDVARIHDLPRLTARGADAARADELIGALVRLAAAGGPATTTRCCWCCTCSAPWSSRWPVSWPTRATTCCRSSSASWLARSAPATRNARHRDGPLP